MELVGIFVFLLAAAVALIGLWGLAAGQVPRFRIENRTHAIIALVIAGLLLYLSIQLVVPADPGDVGIW